MELYTIEEKILFVKLYFSGNSYEEIRALFGGTYPDRPIPSKSTIFRVINQFNETGSVLKPCKCAKQIEEKEERQEKKLNVIAAIENNRNLSLREIEAEISVPFSTARKFLKEEKYNSYKYYKHQELKEEDKFQRATFCELMMEKANADRHFIENVCFSDECTFTLHNKPNVQNFRYWDKTNAHEYVTTHTQYPQKLNVWVGILRNHIIGPYFINGSLNGLAYYNMLLNNIGPAIEDLADDRQILFQQDGCPAHNDLIVRQYLDEVFPNTWIGRNGPIHWPARSPDLAPNDFFMGTFKIKNIQ